MKYFYFLLLFIVSCKSGEKLKKTSFKDFNWNKCVVDIKSESDRYNILEIQKFIDEKGKVIKTYSKEQRDKDYDSLRLITNTITGTALYLADGPNRYLVTAKHVVHDKNFTLRHRYFTREDLTTRGMEFFEKFNAEVTIETPLSLFKKGKYNDFKIPQLDQDSISRPFKFSDDKLDIAILSLQSVQTFPIRRLLEDDGYYPVDISRIDTISENDIGDEVAAIGYPSYSSILNFKINNQLSDNKVVLPLTTFGKVALTDTSLNYFVADVTINPGNSGGPIIKNGKIIGLVSQQMLVNLYTDEGNYQPQISKIYSRSALAYIIKSKFITQYIDKLKIIESNNYFKLQKNVPDNK